MNYGSISEREPLLEESGEEDRRGARFKEAEGGAPLLPQQTHVFKRRWYILLLFSMVALLQDTIWNTWGPIDHTAIFLYGWSHDLVALLANYGSILYILAFFPVVYILNRSLRGAMLMCIGFMALGTVMRAIVLQSPGASLPFFTVSCHICSILNGISNVVIGSGPLVISAVWFPPSERVTATSIAQVLNGLGTGMSFLLASQIVRPIDDVLSNRTFPNGSYPEPSAILKPTELEAIEADIQWYMYSNALPAGLLFLAILVYFPSAPSLPPSLSSTVERLDFIAGFKEVVRTKESWLIAIGCSVPQGVVIAWTAMMVVNLTEICVDTECLTQNWVNNLGIWATLVSTIAAILVARAADAFKGHLKEFLVGLLLSGAVVFLFLSLISIGTIQFGSLAAVKVSVYILLLMGNSLIVSSMPIAMELAMDICYPAGEGVVGGWISIWFNIITVGFLALFDIPGIGITWLDYVLPISCVLAVPFIIPLKVEYKRLNMDSGPSLNLPTGIRH